MFLFIKKNYYISANGEVKTYMFLPVTFGNIRNKSFNDIWSRMVGDDIYNHSVFDCCGEK